MTGHAYSAIGAVVERVVRFVHGEVPTGPDRHRTLIEDARLEIPGVRPALLTRETARDLAELRSFRHLVRHAYAADYDVSRLRTLRLHVLQLAPRLSADLDRLDAWLEALADDARG